MLSRRVIAATAIALVGTGCREGRRSPRSDAATVVAAEAVPSVEGLAPRAPGTLIGTCAATTAEGLGRDQRIDAMLDEAGAHLAQSAWADAFTCADMASDLLPRSIEAHHLRAAALAGADHHDEAGIAYGIALALDPEDPETLRAVADFYLNVVAMKTKDTTALGLELARRGSARAMARRRGQRELRGQLAVLEAQAYNDLGFPDEALERATEALRLSSDLIDGVHERGVALFNLGRFADARAEFERELVSSPDDAFAHHLLGLTLEQMGNAGAAESHLARARALDAEQFPAPLAMSADEMEAEVARVVSGLPTERQAKLQTVPIQVVDSPDPRDLAAVTPPFPPTILGLFRGLPYGAQALPGEEVPARAIVLYRRNLVRAARTRPELVEQIERTLLHEIGHLEGLDEDDLRRHDLE